MSFDPISYDEMRRRAQAARAWGWLAEPEARALHQLAQAAPGPIVEVGCGMGKSTCYLACGEQPVYSVDPHDPELWNPTQKRVYGELADGDTLARARQVWGDCGVLERITPIVAADDAALPDLPDVIGLLFLDANHHLEAVAADLQRYAPRLMPGGLLAMHDWGVRGDEETAWGVAEAGQAYADANGLVGPDTYWTVAVFRVPAEVKAAKRKGGKG